MKAASFVCEREDRLQLRHFNELVRDLRGSTKPAADCA
jgi:hypothetical protein